MGLNGGLKNMYILHPPKHTIICCYYYSLVMVNITEVLKFINSWKLTKKALGVKFIKSVNDVYIFNDSHIKLVQALFQIRNNNQTI